MLAFFTGFARLGCASAVEGRLDLETRQPIVLVLVTRWEARWEARWETRWETRWRLGGPQSFGSWTSVDEDISLVV